MHSKTAFSSLLGIAALFATATISQADHKVKVYRDLDGDGHFNRKTYEPHHHYHHGYYHRPYWGWGGWGWYRPWYRPYFYYPRTSISVYGSPGYSRYSYSDNLAAQVQQALRTRGYYKGRIDGDIGAGSRAAIRAYQQDRGLGVTGRVDTALLRSLRIG